VSLVHEMELQELRDQLAHARNTVSRAINVLQQVRVALEEDDTDEALRLITEATS
jgi:DNA-binding XRE family transcriptional regulator